MERVSFGVVFCGEWRRVSFGVVLSSQLVKGKGGESAGNGGESALELCCLVLRGMEASQLPGL